MTEECTFCSGSGLCAECDGNGTIIDDGCDTIECPCCNGNCECPECMGTGEEQ